MVCFCSIKLIIIPILIISIIIVLFHLITKPKNKEAFSVGYSKHTKDKNAYLNMFDKENEVFIYNIVPGMMPVDPKIIPSLTFKPEELKKAGFKNTIMSKGGIEYVDHKLMVPYLFDILKLQKTQIYALKEDLINIEAELFKLTKQKINKERKDIF